MNRRRPFLPNPFEVALYVWGAVIAVGLVANWMALR